MVNKKMKMCESKHKMVPFKEYLRKERNIKMEAYIKNHNLIKKEKIPDEYVEEIKKFYWDWETFFSVLQSVTSYEPSHQWFTKKIWGVNHPAIYLKGNSVLHGFMLEYNEVCDGVFEIELWNYEDHHPFVYLIDTTDLMLYSFLNEKPSTSTDLIKTNMEIGTKDFIKKCQESEKKWRRMKSMEKIVKCPVCDGTGLVSKPPWVAGDQETWVDSSACPYVCPQCKGKMILKLIRKN